MSDYPEALIEKVARAIVKANADATDTPWLEKEVPFYFAEARAALDALGLREERAQDRFTNARFVRDERRFVTSWEVL